MLPKFKEKTENIAGKNCSMRQTRGKNISRKKQPFFPAMILKYEKPKHGLHSCGEKTEDVILLCNHGITARSQQDRSRPVKSPCLPEAFAFRGADLHGNRENTNLAGAPISASRKSGTGVYGGGGGTDGMEHRDHGTASKSAWGKRERFCFASSTKVLWMNAKSEFVKKRHLCWKKKRTDADQFHFRIMKFEILELSRSKKVSYLPFLRLYIRWKMNVLFTEKREHCRFHCPGECSTDHADRRRPSERKCTGTRSVLRCRNHADRTQVFRSADPSCMVLISMREGIQESKRQYCGWRECRSIILPETSLPLNMTHLFDELITDMPASADEAFYRTF